MPDVRSLFRQGGACRLQLVGEDILDGPVRVRFEGQRPFTGLLQTIASMNLCQPHDPQTRSKTLLRMRPRFHDLIEQSADLLPQGTPPMDQPGWRPFRMFLMRPRHVLRHRRRLAGDKTPDMGRHAAALVKNLQCGLVVSRFDHNTHQCVASGVNSQHLTKREPSSTPFSWHDPSVWNLRGRFIT